MKTKIVVFALAIILIAIILAQTPTVGKINNTAVNDNYATYSHSGLTAEDEGKVVKFTSNNTVGRCSDNDLFIGVVTEIVGDDCIVQIEGVVTVDATTGGFQVGWGTAVANSTGGIKYASPATGKPMYKIIIIDTTKNEITFVVG